MSQAENNVQNSFMFELCDFVVPRMNVSMLLWFLENG
jgi:hypothetical protein